MAINKSGQVALVGFMIFIFIVIATLIMIDPLKSVLIEVRDSSHLDCGNSSISLGTKATCLVVDLTLPYFIGVVIVTASGYLVFRKIFGE